MNQMVSRAALPDRIARTMPSSVPLSISVNCLPIERPFQVLSATSYRYMVSLTSGAAGAN